MFYWLGNIRYYFDMILNINLVKLIRRMRRGGRRMSKHGERRDGGIRDKGKAEEVRKGRVIPKATLRGSACPQPVSLPQTLISEPTGLRTRGHPRTQYIQVLSFLQQSGMHEVTEIHPGFPAA